MAADTALAGGDDGRLRFVLVRETTGSEAQGRWTDEWGVWLDSEGRLVATDAGWFITVLEGRQALLPALRAMETRVREVRAQELEQAVRQPVAGQLVIAGGDVFDSESGTVLPDMTVVVEDDRITRVVPASDYQAPADATVVDARGRTVLPGLWDMHVHLNFGSQTVGMVTKLAAGVTSARDMASDLDVALSHRRRADQGTIASPRMLLAGFMEGPGAWAGPTEVLVRDEAEALRWVARYDSLGYRQIKLYNLIHPDLVPTISREAHRRGMRLSGHIPRGLSLEAAVELGYDEVNHAAFLFSTFFPDSLFVPTMRPYSGVASAVAGDFDVDGPAMNGLLEFLKDHGTVVDGTFAIWEGWGMLDGQGPPSAHAYERLLRRLFEEGVTLVPGTDAASGTQLLVELELYEHAGIPAPEVLRIATLIPATVMGEAADYGSVTAGKIADLVIVDGRPAEHIRDLRRTEWVVRAGRLYRSEDLYRAAGVVPPPHP